MATHHALGIDIGGSGIKGAPVDLDKGRFAEDRLRIATPEEATPDAVCEVVEQIAQHFAVGTDVPLGITLPAVLAHGVVRSAANIDLAWVDLDADQAHRFCVGQRQRDLSWPRGLVAVFGPDDAVQGLGQVDESGLLAPQRRFNL